MEEDCIFCKIVNKNVPCEFVYEDENFVGFLDTNPKAEGHTLIVPKRHYKTLLDLPNSLGNELQEAIKKIGLKLISGKKAEGFNVLVNVGEVADQIVHHLHIHIIPRNDGDAVKIFS